MAQIVTQVREPRLPGTHLLGDSERFLDIHVCRVRLLAEGIDDEMPDATDLFDHGRWHFLAIAQIRREALPIPHQEIAEHGGATVRDWQRSQLGIADAKGFRHFVRLGMEITGEAVLAIEREGKDPAQVVHGVRRCIDRQGTAERAERTQVVETHDVIRVRVRVDHRIQPPDAVAEALRAEIRSGVDDPGALGCFHVHGGAHAKITRVLGGANVAFATDHRHAL